ncbi:MAG: hemerythrin domain-containing protein [Chloroflexota bacterium]
MDAFTLIEQDHERFRKLFKDYEAKGDRAYKGKLEIAQTIYKELAIHETMEEEIFYPAIREHADKEGVDLVLEGFQEHHVADLIVDELRELDIEDETYDAKFKVLQENTEHHLDEEEEELFPKAKKALGDRAVEIGEQMAALKEKLLAEGAPDR